MCSVVQFCDVTDSSVPAITFASDQPVCLAPTSTSTMLSATSSTPFPFQNSSRPDDPDSDVLNYPPKVVKKARKSSKSADKFFVLTSEEAYEAKLQHEKEKQNRELIKHQRVALRRRKAAEKLAMKKKNGPTTSKEIESGKKGKGKNIKSKEVKSQCKSRGRKMNEENWKCCACEGLYFDEAHPNYNSDWVACIHCNVVRFHSVCAIGRGQFDNDDTECGDFTCRACYENMQ